MNSRFPVSKVLTVLFLLFATEGRSDVCRDVFQKALGTWRPADVSYDWTTAIFLYGAEAYARKHGREAELSPYYDELAKKIPEIRDPDKAALSLAASAGDSEPRKKIVLASKKFFTEEPRNSLGTIDHTGARGILGTLYPSSVWADSLIMSSLNQKKILGEEKESSLILAHLRDGDSGLFFHAYYPGPGWKFPTAYHWARGNLWVALFLAETGGDLSGILSAVKKYYVPGKGLRTLIDDPESAFESSATALFGYVLAKSGGDAELLKDVRRTILSFVKENRFTGVSGPTTAFPVPFYYRSLIPRGEYSYGTGAFLLWCAQDN